MAHAALRRLTLTDFRSYERATLELDGRAVLLFGPNGAGKTNLLEAISYLAAGRGLRGANLADVGRRGPGEPQGRAWAVAAVMAVAERDAAVNEVRIGAGVEAGSARRRIRLDGETVQPARLAETLRLAWLTPAQDRLFIEGGTERRRFLDRLAFAAEPAHAVQAAAYDRALRERMRLLTDGAVSPSGADPQWLDVLEARLAEAGSALAAGRRRTLAALQAEIDMRADRPFPQAELGLSGEWGVDGAAEAERLAEALRRGRTRDTAAGRALVGPHRTDLIAVHREKGRPAAECSTGEQKALILNLILAQAARLVRAESAPNPILLLDEVAAHLDASRRGALFDEITALGLQTFLTGTDRGLFEALGARAQTVYVQGSAFVAD